MIVLYRIVCNVVEFIKVIPAGNTAEKEVVAISAVVAIPNVIVLAVVKEVPPISHPFSIIVDVFTGEST